MKRAAIIGARQAALVDAPDPEPHDDWAVVKIHSAPMCAEYKAFEGGQPQSVMGHEAAGELVGVGPCSSVRVGDRVVAMPLVGCGKCAYCLSGDYIHCLAAFEL